MKKVFLNSYAVKNLGDDLFLKIISERYENDFYLISSYKYKNDMNAKILYRNFPIKVLDKLLKIITNKNLEERIIGNSDIVVTLAGSIFIEGKDIKKSWYKTINKDYYILGSNIGPYCSELFLEEVKEILRNAKDVCLRDKKSFGLCENLKNVRHAPDLIFSLDVLKYKVTENKKVIFSIINCERKAKQIKFPDREAYELKICEMIDFFQNQGYEIEFMSFCQKEGDEDAINSIINKLKNIDNVQKYFYNGNIEEALKEINSSKIIVGTRFHANVLGLAMNKTIIPICYNDKTFEMLKDIDFKGKIIDINNIRKFDVETLNKQDLNYKCDVSYQKEEAKKHFQNLDKILKLRREN